MSRPSHAIVLLLLLACGRSQLFGVELQPPEGNPDGGASGGGGEGGGAGVGGGDAGGTGASGGTGGGDDSATSCSPGLCGARVALAGGELTTLDASRQATQVDTTFDSLGRPVIAYGMRATSAGPTQLIIRRLEHGRWVQLGCSPGDPSFSTAQLATDESGNLLVAWIEMQSGPGGGSQVAVAQWNGTAWQPLGPPFRLSQGATFANRVGLVLSHGTPLLAWDENVASGTTASGGRIFVARWDGAQWQALGPPLVGLANEALEELAVAVDVDGQPVVLYTPVGLDLPDPRLRKWDGAAWQPIATPRTRAPFVRAVGGFRIDAQGHYYLGFSDSPLSTGPRSPHVAKYDGVAWSLIGDGFEPMQDVELYDVALERDGTPVVAVTRRHLPAIAIDAAILRWDGHAWTPVIDFSDFPKVDSNIALAGGPAGDLHAIWSILQSGGFTIHVWHSVATQCL